jgi:glyceraldehyde 3-phosphate dehydrogenase
MRIAINGFGRIGRIFLRQALGHEGIEIVAINDLGLIENLAYLLRHDSVYGLYDKKVETKDGLLIVDGKEIKVFNATDPATLPWGALGIDVVVESTGAFTSYEKASAHLKAGAKRVVISAPAKDAGETKTATPNVGVEFLKEGLITSNASCTTNATTPVIAVMLKEPGIEKSIMSTVHGYTATQILTDSPVRGGDFRRGRAAAANIVPSTTGAADAVGRVLPETKGKFDGVSIRVPVISGSLVDLTFIAKRNTTATEINKIFIEASQKPEWQGILATTTDQPVSSDILAQPYGAIIDLELTRVVDGNLVKVFAWYDNEWGYCSMLIKHVEMLKSLL